MRAGAGNGGVPEDCGRAAFGHVADTGPLDEWLMLAFAPHRLTESIEAMYDAQPADDRDSARVSASGVIAECDRKISRYREALDAGADPVLVAAWIAEVQARRAEAAAQMGKVERPSGRLSREKIRDLAESVSGVRGVLAQGDPAAKAEVYKQIGMRLTYQPGRRVVRAQATLDHVGQGFVSEGGVDHYVHALHQRLRIQVG